MRIYHIGSMEVSLPEVSQFLDDLGVERWVTDAHSGGEYLVELGGRLCYKSFEPGLNPNVEKIREGNKAYVGNIIRQLHGSVIEHAVDSFIITDVSRVLTHELVRHRHLSISQESLRYVRIEEIDLVEPQIEAVSATLEGSWKCAAWAINHAYKTLLTMVNWNGLTFKAKKALTSALRRLIPMGQKTSLMATANNRAWRWMIEARTGLGAEEEIRRLFLLIFRELKKTHPAIYQDAEEQSDGTVKFGNSKV